MAGIATVVLAHQGGWDEILFVVGPILVVVALLRLLKRRVEQNLPAEPAADGTPAAGTPADDLSSR